MRCPLGYDQCSPDTCTRAPCLGCMREFGELIVVDIQRLGAAAVEADLSGRVRVRMGLSGVIIGLLALVRAKGEQLA